MQLRSHNREAFNDLDQANDDRHAAPAPPKHGAAKRKTRRVAVSSSKPIVVEPDESDADDCVQWEGIDSYFVDREATQPLPFVTSTESPININISESTVTTASMGPEPINGTLEERDTTPRLSFGDDVLSSDWEMLPADVGGSNLRGEDAGRTEEPMEYAENDGLAGRYSVSSFDSGCTRLSFYRDESPSPVSNPAGPKSFKTPKRVIPGPVRRLRFDNDSSDSEGEEPASASSTSFRTASEGISSEESSGQCNPRFWRAFTGTVRSAALGNGLTECELGKQRMNDADPFDSLSGISLNVARMEVLRQTLSPLTAASNAELHAGPLTKGKRRSQQVLSAIDASSSEPPLFKEIHGQPGGYTLTANNLGQGNFGIVNVAVREYAVKKVNAADAGAMSQCIAGVAAMRSANHENIVRLKEAFHDVDSDLFYVIMEKMEGSVYHLIKFNGGYLTEEHALVILRCTAKALAYLHSRGFVHRDVKSDNVLVGRNCEVKLADLDSVAAENASLNGVAGTPHWVAPEVARIVFRRAGIADALQVSEAQDAPDAPYTAKVDTWSFAIFATEFALGAPPFFTGERQPLAEICGTICNPQYVASVNEQVRRAGLPDVARLVEYCLKTEPAQRPSMSEILAVMSFLGEPDQQVLLEPIHRMLHRRPMTPNH